jgi:integrase
MKLSLIRKPTQEELQKGYLRLTIGGKDGVETKNSKERIIEIPSLLMKNLYEYTISERYLNRKKLSNAGNISLFINNKGDTFNNDTLNSRWSEVRNAIRLDYPSFNHKAHNLRPTYGVSRLKQLVNSGMQQADALSYIQNRMGHSSLATTLHYLHQLNNPKSGDELSEIAFDYLLDLGD